MKRICLLILRFYSLEETIQTRDGPLKKVGGGGRRGAKVKKFINKKMHSYGFLPKRIFPRRICAGKTITDQL